MVQHYTRFVGLTVAQPAPGWAGFGAAPFSHTAETDSFGEAHLRVQRAGSGIGGLTWDAVPVAADAEVYVEVQSTSGSTLTGRFKAGARMDPAAVTAYLGGHGQTVQERITKYTPASGTVVQSATSRYPAGTRVRIRFRASGTSLMVKVWAFGEHEPATWELTATDTSLVAAGRVGIFSFGSGTVATDSKVYAVGVGTGGDPAPRTHYASPIWGQVPRQITFPFAPDVVVNYVEGWDLLRDGGTREHRGTDMYVSMGTPVYAMTAGTVAFQTGSDGVITPGSGGGYSVHVDDADGKVRRTYLHLGPNESGRAAEAFAPGIVVGATVTQGQLVGWSGESGASASGPHLHTDFRDLACDVTDDPYGDYLAVVGSEDAPRFDPYPSLVAADPNVNAVRDSAGWWSFFG